MNKKDLDKIFFFTVDDPNLNYEEFLDRLMYLKWNRKITE